MDEQRIDINCVYPDESTLYAAYMSFVKGGGLFIRTNHMIQFGTVVHLSIQLMSEEEPYKIEGKVVWVTPTGAQGNKAPGMGVQFLGENSQNLCRKIETYLAGMLKLQHLTDTM